MKLAWSLPAAVFLFLLLYLTLGRGVPKPRVGKLTPASPASPESCVGKSPCLVAMVAPWCPYCRESTPMLKSLIAEYEGSSRFTVNVVVSADEPAAINKYAAEFGKGAFRDTGTAFAESIGVKSFPAWFLFDKEGNVVQRSSGAFTDKARLLNALKIY